MKKLAAILMLLTVWFGVRAEVAIMGERVVDAARMAEFVSRHNPDFDPAIAEAFATVGDRYGIRGDIALCQAILETGWFRFGGGTAVSPDFTRRLKEAVPDLSESQLRLAAYVASGQGWRMRFS